MKRARDLTAARGMEAQETHPAREAQRAQNACPCAPKRVLAICLGSVIPSPPGARRLARFLILSQPVELWGLFLFLGRLNLFWTSSRRSDSLPA